jgi:hypothetical protein
MLRIRTLALLPALACGLPTAAQPVTTGCGSWANGRFNFQPGDILASTGVVTLDHFIFDQSVELMILFRVVPELRFLTGEAAKTAFAFPGSEATFSCGTIYLGNRLLLGEMAATDRGFPAIVGILAHEFGHILQYKMNGGNVTLRPELELHADFLAGYYLGKREFVRASDIELFLRTLFEHADPASWYRRPGHGNGDQRATVMLAGYRNSHRSVSEAYAEGNARVGELVGNFFTNFESGSGEIPDSAHDPAAATLLRRRDVPVGYQSEPNPQAIYEYHYRNDDSGGRTIIVKAVIESRVRPVRPVESVDDAADDSRILTHRTVQFRLAPGASQRVSGTIPTTGQGTIVYAYVAPREVVVFAPAAQPPSPMVP